MKILPPMQERLDALGLQEQPDGSFRAHPDGRRTYPREAVLLIAMEPDDWRRQQMLTSLKAIVCNAPVSAPAKDDLRDAAEALLDACVTDFGDPVDFEGDEGAVMSSLAGDGAVTFKHLRDLRGALTKGAGQ